MEKNKKKKNTKTTKATKTTKTNKSTKTNKTPKAKKTAAHSKPIAKKDATAKLKKDAVEVKFEETAAEQKARTFQLIVLIILAFVLLLFLSNRTFFRTKFTKKVDDKEIVINLPRFTYFVSDKDETLTFTTLRKSENTISYYEHYLESESFDLYTCANKKEPIYYNRGHKYFLYDVEVNKTFIMKTVTIKYSLSNVDEICHIFE